MGGWNWRWDVFDDGASYAQVRFGAQLIYRERDADSATYGYFSGTRRTRASSMSWA